MVMFAVIEKNVQFETTETIAVFDNRRAVDEFVAQLRVKYDRDYTYKIEPIALNPSADIF